MWNKTEEELPEFWKPVLLYAEHNDIYFVGYYDHLKRKYREQWDDNVLDRHWKITHWRELDKPVKEN